MKMQVLTPNAKEKAIEPITQMQLTLKQLKKKSTMDNC